MKADLKFHVIVVGGGIAGASVARFLTGSGLSVLVLDKKSAFDEKIICGELVQKWVLEFLGFVDDESIISSRVRRVVIENMNTNSQFEHEVDDFLYVIDKGRLIMKLLEGAADAGGTVLSSFRFVGIDKIDGTGVVSKALYHGAELTLRSDFLIAADGVFSKVADELGWDHGGKPPLYGVNMLLKHKDVEDSTLKFWTGSDFNGGYGWSFSKSGNKANVGVVGSSFEAVMTNFGRLTSRNFEGASVFRYGMKRIPAGLRRTFATANVLAVGDAGYFVEPLSYAGIWGSVMSAKLASDAILSHYRDGVSTDEVTGLYRKNVRRVFAKRFKLASMVTEIVRQMDDRDWDDFLNGLNEGLADRKLEALGPFEISKIMLGNRRIRNILKRKLGNAVFRTIQKIIH